MKKLICMILALLLTACASAEGALVVYFSHAGENYNVGVVEEGNTAKLAKEIAADVRAKVSTGKKPPNNPLNRAENKLWPAIAGKKAQGFRVSGACVGCGQCVKLCPKGNIRLENGRAVIGSDCLQCLGCLQYCPRSAISLGSVTDKREHYHNPNVRAEELTEQIIHVD